MKTFILILYILFLFVIPQMYTWACREVLENNSQDEQFVTVFFGGIVIALMITFFTLYLVKWDILNMNT